MRRTALLAALVAACAPKPIRPAPDVELVQATPIGPGHALLLFKDPSPSAHPRYHIARHAVDGPLAWQRALETRDIPEINLPVRVLGDAALIPISTGSLVPSDSFLFLRLTTGEVHKWAPTRPSSATHPDSAVVGDERQIFVAWRRGDDLEISAFDPTSGALQWSFVDDRPARVLPRLRLGAGHLLLGDPTGEWRALARADGTLQPLPTLDGQSTVCTALGRQWAQRDDHLVTLDADEQRSAVATFIPPAMRHQWSLVDCAATAADQVVLAVNIDPLEAGMLVALDPATLAPRWNVELTFGLTTRAADGADTWPAVLGDVIFAEERGQTCAVAQDPPRVLWCTDWYTAEGWRHGRDMLLAGYSPERDEPDTVHLVRVRGDDGQVAAAVTLRDTRLRNHGIPRTTTLQGDHLWFSLSESDLRDHGKLPLLVLDAATLRPVPPPFGRADLGALVVDAMPSLADIFPRASRVQGSELDALHDSGLRPPTTQNPWDAIFLPPEDRGAGPLAARHAELLAAAREAARLPADLELRPLAWCDDRIVAVAEQHAGDTTRWILLKGRQDGDDPPEILTRAHDRPLAAVDIDRFLLLAEYGLVSSRIDPCSARGSVDEAVWRSVTREPRTSQWTLRVSDSTR